MTLANGTQLGPYEIVGPLGAGGMGEVYRARDKRLDREVAVKVLPEQLAKDSDALRRFEREAKAVAALSHPNILAIHDVGTAPPASPLATDPDAPHLAKGGQRGVSYVVMELLEGETLRERVRRSAIPWRKAIEYGVAIADGLAAAHAKGIIHRDLKPENIFLTKDGAVKILDFGLARVGSAVGDTPREAQADTPTMTLDTRPGTVLGTVNYMSPEQISGRTTDVRTDIFSFGCVLYEMISGQRAFGGESIAETTTAILRDEPPTLSDSGQTVPAELDRVITRCHEKKPEQRFQSSGDLAFTLRNILSGSGLSKPTIADRGPRMRTMLGVQVAVGAVAVVALLVALNVGGWRERLFSRPQAVSINSLAVLPLENLSGDPEQEYFADGMTGELITALGKISALKVISRMSVMGYKDTHKLPPEMARELNVDALVEGTVTRVGDRVRITANLIRASTSEHLWGDSYERDLRDVLALQGEIARAIADQIQAKLTPQEQTRLASAPLVNPDAYQAYLRGLDHARRPDSSEPLLRLAVQMFERAVKLDPGFAVAYAGLSEAHSQMHHEGYDTTEARAAKAKAAVDRAFELQPDLPEAHLALGWYHYWCHRDYDRALEEFAVAEKDLPTRSGLLLGVGSIRRRQGDFKVALDQFTRAFELSPKDALLAFSIAETYTLLRRYAEADDYYDRSISLAPDQASAYVCKTEVQWLRDGDTERTRATLEEMPTSLSDDSLRTWFRQEVFEREYRAALDRLALTSGESHVSQFWFSPKAQLAGQVYRLMGDPERARGSYDSARVVLEKEVMERPDDHRGHSSLGIVYAALGRKNEAIREGKLGVELFPVSKDAYIGPFRVEDLAFIYTLVGEYDEALDRIEYLLSIPSWLSVPLLRLDPRWDSLRDHPRYKALLRRHGFEPTRAAGFPGAPGRGGASADSSRSDGRIKLAVLPFEDSSPDPQEWFSASMTGELIATLGRINALGVISKTSIMRYKNTVKPLPQVARELNVSKLVEGNVLRIGEQLRITVTLIDAATDTQLWSNSYQRDYRDVIGLQNEVARAIAQEIQVKVTAQEQSQLTSTASVNPEAHEAYLKGRYFWNKRTPEGLRKGLEYFQRAARLDPDFAPAYVGVADSFVVMGQRGQLRPHEAFPQAKAAARKALDRDDTLGEARIALGAVLASYDWDWAGAEREYKRALQLSPGYATGHQWYAEHLALMGRHEEAVAEIRRALKLDPLSLAIHAIHGQVFQLAREYDQGIELCRRALALDPGFPMAHAFIGWAYEAKGMHEEAIAEFVKVSAVAGTPFALGNLGHAYAVAGQQEQAREVLDELLERSKREYVDPTQIARVYVGLGDKDKAFAWLETAYKERAYSLVFIKVEQAYDPLRDDPRFDDLLRRIGLEPDPKPRSAAEPTAGKTGDGKTRLLVLPFANISADPEQEYFSDGMTEEIIAQLGRLQPKKLAVIARTTAMQYKDTKKQIDQIGRELRVEYIIEGSVRRAGGRVRITAQLIQVSDQGQLWSDIFERELTDVFALQANVAQRVARSLALELLPDQKARLARDRPVNPAAYDSYLLGRHHFNKWSPVHVKQAIEHFQRAIDIDPAYAAAYAGLADCYAVSGFFGYLRPKEAYSKQMPAVMKALEIDGSLGEAHVSLGAARLYHDWDWAGAERSYKRAIELDPSFTWAHQLYAWYLGLMGRFDEAIAEANRAREIDPLSPTANWVLGELFYCARQYDRAIEQSQLTLELDANDLRPRLLLAWAYEKKGMYDEAVTELERVVTLSQGQSLYVAALGQAYAGAGKTDAARKILADLIDESKHTYVRPHDIALLHASLGQMDQAFQWLDKAYEQRDAALVCLKAWPWSDNLRSDPRFDELLRRIGLWQ